MVKPLIKVTFVSEVLVALICIKISKTQLLKYFILETDFLDYV